MFCVRADVQGWKRELGPWKAWYVVRQYLGRQWAVAGRVGDGMCGTPWREQRSTPGEAMPGGRGLPRLLLGPVSSSEPLLEGRSLCRRGTKGEQGK